MRSDLSWSCDSSRFSTIIVFLWLLIFKSTGDSESSITFFFISSREVDYYSGFTLEILMAS